MSPGSMELVTFIAAFATVFLLLSAARRGFDALDRLAVLWLAITALAMIAMLGMSPAVLSGVAVFGGVPWALLRALGWAFTGRVASR